jgi:hypothetical protein
VKEFPWYRKDASAFLSSMSGRRQGEIAAYSILEAMMMERGEPLPLNLSILARRCGMPNAAALRSAIDGLIADGLLTETGDGKLWSPIAVNEMAHRADRSRGGAKAASHRWQKKINEISVSPVRPHDREEKESECPPNPPRGTDEGVRKKFSDEPTRTRWIKEYERTGNLAKAAEARRNGFVSEVSRFPPEPPSTEPLQDFEHLPAVQVVPIKKVGT